MNTYNFSTVIMLPWEIGSYLVYQYHDIKDLILYINITILR